MNKQIKKVWIDALRSGKYKQGKEAMYEDGTHCCLGVLAEIYATAELGMPTKDARANMPALCLGYTVGWYDEEHDEFPATPIRSWAGIKFITVKKLASMNDDGKTFTEIADYIEKKL